MITELRKKQSKWIICGLEGKTDEWIIIGNRNPMLSPDEFYTAIEPYRKQFSRFGVWVVPSKWSATGVLVSKKHIRSIDEIFLDKTQIKCSDDILEGMVFVEYEGGRTVSVLASRAGFIMLKGSADSDPELLFWQDLVDGFGLSDSLTS